MTRIDGSYSRSNFCGFKRIAVVQAGTALLHLLFGFAFFFPAPDQSLQSFQNFRLPALLGWLVKNAQPCTSSGRYCWVVK